MSRGENDWLLIKARDGFADEDWKIETVLPVEKKKKSKKAKS
jgi:hypothetical protein